MNKINVKIHVLRYYKPKLRVSCVGIIIRNTFHFVSGARVEIEDKRGNTALHTAARHGHASVTKTLVSNGANVLKRGAGGMLPVHMACLSGYSDCVENLIPRGK